MKNKAQNGKVVKGSIPEEFFIRQAYKESTLDPKAISKAGAKGLTQLRKDAITDYLKAHKLKAGAIDPLNPEHAVKVQKWYMNNLYNADFINKPNQSEQVRLAKAAAAYNWGRGNLSNHLNAAKKKGLDIYNTFDWLDMDTVPSETREYVNKIVRKKDKDFEKEYLKAYETDPDIKYYNIKKKQDGGVIEDDRGQWAHPGKITKINSNNITMKGVDYPVLGVSDTGDTKMMLPNQDYKFNGSSVTEYPQKKRGLKEIDQLTNFTDMNKSKKAQNGKYIAPKGTRGSLPPDVIRSYQEHLKGEDIVPFVDFEETDPIIYKKDKFIDFYRKKALKKFTPEELDLSKTMPEDAYLMSRGGIPDFDMYQKFVRDYEKNQIKSPTDWKNLDSNITPTKGGYRYGAKKGEGLPAKGSITIKEMGGEVPKAQWGNFSGMFKGMGGANAGANAAGAAKGTVQGTSSVAGAGAGMMGGGAMGMISNMQESMSPMRIIEGIQMIRAEKEKKREAKQYAKMSNVVKEAAALDPEKVKRKYFRPEDQLVDPNEMFPTYGAGTNFLAKNGGKIKGNKTEIMNTYDPADIYKDLGYEPLNDSKIKKANWGQMLAAQGGQDAAGQVGQIGGGYLSGAGPGGSGGSNLGGQIGGAIGSIWGPVGQMVGTAAGGLIGGAIDQNPRRTKRWQKKGDRNMRDVAIMQSFQGLNNQNAAFMEHGGEVNPQVIKKFGNVNMADLYSIAHEGMDTLRTGGHIRQNYAKMGGELKTHWGGEAETVSQNPYLPDGGESVLFKGQSHDDGGIGVTFGNAPVEVEGGEPAVKMEDGGGTEGLVVFGNMQIPKFGAHEIGDPSAKGRKFKSYINDLNKVEAKQNKIVSKGTQLVNETDPNDVFDELKMSSGKAMMLGGNMKLKEIAAKKQKASMVQNAILETADELGLQSDELAKGNIKKAKNGGKFTAQTGATIYDYEVDEYKNKGYEVDPENPNRLRIKITTPGSTQFSKRQGSKHFNDWFAANYKEGKTGNYKDPKTGERREILFKRDSGTTTPGTERYEYVDIKSITSPKVPLPSLETDLSVGIPNLSPVATKGQPAANQEQASKKFGWLDTVNSMLPYFRPSNQRNLDPNQLMGEMYALSNNQVDPVNAQLYNPLLEQVSDISLQDQLNANQADFNSLQRQAGYNPAAQAALAAQKYAANSAVLGEQFRMNQGQKQGVYNRNRATLNDAQLRNIASLDRQFVRQTQAKSATKATAQAALNSISDKIAKNKLENRTLGVYENLYNYRFGEKGQAWNLNPLVDFEQMIANASPEELEAIEKKITTRTGPKGELKEKKVEIKSSRNGSIVKAIKNL